MVITSIPAVYDANVRKAIVDRVKKETVYDKIFNVKGTTLKTFNDVSFSGTGIAEDMTDDQKFNFDVINQDYTNTYTQKKIGLGLAFSEQSQMFDKLNICKGGIALGRSVRARIEQDHANILIKGLLATQTWGDGVALFSAGHKLKRGGTASNTHAHADMSATFLKEVIALMDAAPDRAGLVDDSREPKFIILPDEAACQGVREILKSSLIAGVTDNTINILRDSLTIIKWKYITPADCFILTSAKEDHELNSFFSKKPDAGLKSYVNNETNAWCWTISVLYQCGCSDWRGTYGVPGA